MEKYTVWTYSYIAVFEQQDLMGSPDLETKIKLINATYFYSLTNIVIGEAIFWLPYDFLFHSYSISILDVLRS